MTINLGSLVIGVVLGILLMFTVVAIYGLVQAFTSTSRDKKFQKEMARELGDLVENLNKLSEQGHKLDVSDDDRFSFMSDYLGGGDRTKN